MKTLEVSELIPYIRNVVELETSVYEQETNYTNAKAKTVAPEIKKQELPPPVNGKENLQKPVEPMDPQKAGKKLVVPIVICALMCVVFIILSILGNRIFDDYAKFTLLFLSIYFAIACFVGCIIFSSILSKKKDKAVKEAAQYQRELDQYNQACNYYDEEYKKNMHFYQIAVNDANRKYLAESRNAQVVCTNAQVFSAKIYESLLGTKEVLKKYYDLDVIFPKYRNLVAISSFLEYFETGRCTELAGPNGAYNLFETELRQNIIIGQLGQVVCQMEQIKQNQFVLYQELNKANANISQMNDKMSRVLQTTEQVSVNSAITAYCSQITAENSEYIASLASLG